MITKDRKWPRSPPTKSNPCTWIHKSENQYIHPSPSPSLFHQSTTQELPFLSFLSLMACTTSLSKHPIPYLHNTPKPKSSHSQIPLPIFPTSSHSQFHGLKLSTTTTTTCSTTFFKSSFSPMTHIYAKVYLVQYNFFLFSEWNVIGLSIWVVVGEQRWCTSILYFEGPRWEECISIQVQRQASCGLLLSCRWDTWLHQAGQSFGFTIRV